MCISQMSMDRLLVWSIDCTYETHSAASLWSYRWSNPCSPALLPNIQCNSNGNNNSNGNGNSSGNSFCRVIGSCVAAGKYGGPTKQCPCSSRWGMSFATGGTTTGGSSTGGTLNAKQRKTGCSRCASINFQVCWCRQTQAGARWVLAHWALA